MKIVGIIALACVLSSYVPVPCSSLCLSSVAKSESPMDNCHEGNQTGSTANTKMECCYAFHSPMICDGGPRKPSPLPFNGLLTLSPDLVKVDLLTHLIFHPPKNRIISVTQG